MFVYEYGRRLDTIDYVNMGTSVNWYHNDTITLLTSFEMEINNYYDRPDCEDVYSRLYDRYNNYMSHCMFGKLFEYKDGLTPEDREINHFEGAVGFDVDRANFNKDMFIEFIQNDNKLFLDIERLKKFIYGEEVPKVPIKVKKQKQNYEKLSADNANSGHTNNYTNIFYEDIISEETILKYKDLPLPLMKQQVVMLAAEKKKSDAAIIAAVKIGLLFYEEGLSKPATKDLFIAEYKKHLDKLPSLHDTTIERIYRHLPEGYRRSLAGGKVVAESTELDQIIKAAVFAGYKEGTEGDITGNDLVSALRDESYKVPEEGIIQKILEAMNKLQ
jgi:hypothetical protein